MELEHIKKSINEGLSTEEVKERIDNGLINKEEKARGSKKIFEIIFRNLFTFLNVIMFIIAVILFTFKLYKNCIFIFILSANLLIGIYSDIKAKMAVDKLSLIQRKRITVIRDGKETEIFSDEIVLDDILHLRTNDVIPCDSTCLFGKAKVNESILTGESDVIKKNVDDSLLSGSVITSGDIYARVDKVGAENYIRTLQKKSKEFKKVKSRLYIEINSIFKYIALFVLILGLLQIGITILSNYIYGSGEIEWTYEYIGNYFVAPLSGAIISLIPSGMYLLFSTSLAAGVITLSGKRVLVQDMYSLDTLARVDVLCLDKTGTLTDGTMEVYDVMYFENNYKKEEIDEYIKNFNSYLNENNFTAHAIEDYFGDGNNLEPYDKINFDSDNKYSAASFKGIGTVVMGAYGFVNFKNLNEDAISKIFEFSLNGERVLLIGISKNYIENEKLPEDIELVAVVRIRDHIKEDAHEIIEWFKENDVKIKIISGDNPLTIQNVALNVGLKDDIKTISLEGLTDDEVKKIAQNYDVFGRVTPEQKRIVIEGLKESGHTVAMFGDGVNDILAFKSSNVSISIANASEAAKELANLVLIDNNFCGLPYIVSEGRRVINNLQRTCSLFLVKTVFSVITNIFFMIFGLCGGLTWNFVPGTFYVWELCSIGLSAFFLALEPNKERIEGGFISNILQKALPSGIVISLGVIILYLTMYFTHMFDRNAFIYRTITTYYISIVSMFVLIGTCVPLNKYRASVITGSIIVGICVFIWSIYGTNWLSLYGPKPPRHLSPEMIAVLAIALGITFVFILLVFGIPYIIKRKKKK